MAAAVSDGGQKMNRHLPCDPGMNRRYNIPRCFPVGYFVYEYITNEKALRETQTLRAGCSKAEPKIFALPQTSLPGSQDGQNLISWRWPLPSHTDPVW